MCYKKKIINNFVVNALLRKILLLLLLLLFLLLILLFVRIFNYSYFCVIKNLLILFNDELVLFILYKSELLK